MSDLHAATDLLKHRILKPALDAFGTAVQQTEHLLDRNAVYLPGFGRSFQVDDASCGAQTTFLILRYFGKARSIRQVTRELGTDKHGTGPASIRRLLQKRGLKTHRMNRATIEDIRSAIDRGAPVLLCASDGSHWIVAYGYSRKAIYIHDPSPRPRAAFCRWSTRKLVAFRDRSALVVWKE